MPARLQLHYVHSNVMGYGRYGTKLAEAIRRRGVDIDEHMDDTTVDPPKTVCWVSVPSHAEGWFKGQNVVLSTMWESQQLPESMREGLHNFHRIIVPSQQNLELYSRYHNDVVKVPLGVDTDDWAYRPRPPVTREFVYLIGGSGPRKGIDLAAKAFRRLFSNPASYRGGPIPKLILKSPRSDNVPAGSGMEHVGGHLSDKAEQDLYGAAHCYLQPSRGEGWGLQPLQAIAQGIPTILTDAHGQHEFAHLGYPISAVDAKAEYFIYGDAGSWWEPSLDELCDQMRWVYDNYETAELWARGSSVLAHRDFSWDRVASLFVEALGGTEALSEPLVKGDWERMKVKRYPLRVRRPYRCEIAGTDYEFLPGNTYMVVADVKRILFEGSDVLDESCLTNDDTGLTEAQVALLPEYLNAIQYCSHCHQLLGSGVQMQFPDEVLV